MSEAFSFDTAPPKEVTDYFETKGLSPAFSWQDVWQEEHAFAFTVAKLTEETVLREVRDSLKIALAQGQSFADWKRGIKPLLEKRGWDRRTVTDPVTGEEADVRLTAPRRLRTIYDTNMRTARSAGQWQRIQRTKAALPFLIYTLGPSKEHRPHHEDKEGTVLAVDDPFWLTWMGPNGWGCKCGVRQISEAEARRRGWTTDTRAPDVPDVPFENSRTGERTSVPMGIDPGFASNPGQSRLNNVASLLKGELDGADEARAISAARDLARSPMVKAVSEGKVDSWTPVAVLPADVVAKVNAGGRTLTLSNQTGEKQFKRHPDLSATDYAFIQNGLLTGSYRRSGQRSFLVYWKEGDQWYRAAFKVTDKGELFLSTFHKQNERSAQSQMRRYPEF